MSTVRAGQPGATRVCPHCKATVLESAAICPGCRHHLRFNDARTGAEPYSAFCIDGTIAHKVSSEPCEFCVIVDVSNERGEKVLRQVVGVGALQPGERRRLNVTVEMLPVVAQIQSRPQPAAGSPVGRDPRPAAAAASVAVPAPARPVPAAAPAPLNPPRAAPTVSRAPTPAAVGPAAGAARGSTTGGAAGTASGLTVRPADKLQPPTPGAPPPAQRLRIFRKP